MSSELIFVTGASGFLGAHVVHQLLNKGYRVRAAARGAKADALKATYTAAGYASDRFDVVKIADIAHDQFPDALVGIDAVLHLASPLPWSSPPAEMLQVAEEGTMNVLVQAEKAGVKRMVVTASIASVTNPQDSYTPDDWSPVTREIALTTDNTFLTYQASKKYAELALWVWAEKHPHVEVTTFNPPFFYGPFAPLAARAAPGDFAAISTNTLLYHLLFPDGLFPTRTRYIDVRDVAMIHVAALSGRPTSEVGRKRMILSAPTGWPFARTVEFIAKERPELRERLITKTPVAQSLDFLPTDWERFERVLGVKKSDFKTTEETTLDTVDTLLELEKEWIAAGWEKKTPPKVL